MWVWLGNWCLHRHPAGYHTQWLLYITHTCTFNGPFPGLSGWASTRKVKPIWILLKQETVSGSGISWTICKSAPCSRQITTPALHHSVFYRPGCPFCLPTTGQSTEGTDFFTSAVWKLFILTRSSAITDRPDSTLCQSKSFQLLHNCKNQLYNKSATYRTYRVRAFCRLTDIKLYASSRCWDWSTSFVDNTMNLLWWNFLSPAFGTKFQSEIPLFLEVLKFPFKTMLDIGSFHAKNQLNLLAILA